MPSNCRKVTSAASLGGTVGNVIFSGLNISSFQDLHRWGSTYKHCWWSFSENMRMFWRFRESQNPLWWWTKLGSKWTFLQATVVCAGKQLSSLAPKTCSNEVSVFPFQPVQPLYVSQVSFLNLDTDITMTKSKWHNETIIKPSSTLPDFLPLPSAPLYPALLSSSLSPMFPETHGWHWDIRCRVDPGGFHHKEG